MILRAARALGLFSLAKRLTAQDLRILCFHGAALDDEAKYRPGLFIRSDTFDARMGFLVSQGYPVLRLEEALGHLDRGTLPPGGTVITIDDGWYGTYRHMVPLLKRYGLPATLYVSTYYLEKQTQVFNVALGYALWRTSRGTIELRDISEKLSGVYDLGDASERDAACEKLNAYANELDDAEARQELLREVCRLACVDWQDIETRRIASFMTLSEAKDALASGLDLQLHTHRHRFPNSESLVKKELAENRAVLRRVSDRPLHHFCYPSGEYTHVQLPWLERSSVASATTTAPGFNRAGVARLELSRFLDSESISLLEFEAEMSGFFELIRRCGYAI